MKKLFLSLLIALSATIMMAVPALKQVVSVVQPDGTTLNICLHGDEYLNFTTTEDGYSVVKDAKGRYVYAQHDTDGQLQATTVVAHNADIRDAQELAFLKLTKKRLAPTLTPKARMMKQTNEARQAKVRQSVAQHAPQYDYANFRGLVILVEFNDKKFSLDNYRDIMDDMFNVEDYTGFTNANSKKESYTGSVHDYFKDNSLGLFKPKFDVYGPYEIDYSQYDANGTADADKLVYAAVNKADKDIDFSQYDRDMNGVVELVYFIFAGNGSNFADNDSRLYWPHRYVVMNPNASSGNWTDYMVVKDNVLIYDYASSVELYGFTSRPSTIKIDGIGTICHEFSHVLGLPDFYDTDNQESGGECITPNSWSIMAGGSYYNDNRTPAGYNLFERYAVGFTTPQTIKAEGNYTLEDIATSNTGYRINSENKKEYFLLENRQDGKWDKFLPGTGMLVFRVDSSSTSAWKENKVNANPNHSYFELLRAGGYKKKDWSTDPFPGTLGKTKLNNETTPANLMTWSGKKTRWGLKDIKETNGIISFNIEDLFKEDGITLPTVDANDELTPIVYYTLDGRRISGALTAGAYIERKGNHVRKILVK